MATVAELSRQYRMSCAQIRLRIKELKEQMADIPADGSQTWAEIDRRQRALSRMLRETREVSRYLEHYYGATARNYPFCLSGMYVAKHKED